MSRVKGVTFTAIACLTKEVSVRQPASWTHFAATSSGGPAIFEWKLESAFAGCPASDEHQTQQERRDNGQDDQPYPHLTLAGRGIGFAVLRELAGHEIVVVEIVSVIRVIIVAGIYVVVTKATRSADFGV